MKLQKFVNENENLREDFETMQNFLEKVEQNLSFEKAKLSIGTSNITELVEPAPTDSFEAFRLVMSQFEIFNFDLKNVRNLTLFSRLLSLLLFSPILIDFTNEKLIFDTTTRWKW